MKTKLNWEEFAVIILGAISLTGIITTCVLAIGRFLGWW